MTAITPLDTVTAKDTRTLPLGTTGRTQRTETERKSEIENAVCLPLTKGGFLPPGLLWTTDITSRLPPLLYLNTLGDLWTTADPYTLKIANGNGSDDRCLRNETDVLQLIVVHCQTIGKDGRRRPHQPQRPLGSTTVATTETDDRSRLALTTGVSRKAENLCRTSVVPFFLMIDLFLSW